jgi:hypothetical protein
MKIQSLHSFGGSKLYVTIGSLGCAVVLMSEPIINDCNSVMSILTNHVVCVDDEGEDGVQDLNLIPIPVIKFSYFVNAYESTVATDIMT